jgi:hypothetical protein
MHRKKERKGRERYEERERENKMICSVPGTNHEPQLSFLLWSQSVVF